MTWVKLAKESVQHLEEEVADLLGKRRKFEEEMDIERASIKRQKRELSLEAASVQADRESVQAEREALRSETQQMTHAGIDGTDIIGINMGGERVISVKRSLLTQFESSMLGRMFSGRHEMGLDRDSNGNVFFDYAPEIMSTLIDYLRIYRDAGDQHGFVVPEFTNNQRQQWKAMLKFLMLDEIIEASLRERQEVQHTESEEVAPDHENRHL